MNRKRSRWEREQNKLRNRLKARLKGRTDIKSIAAQARDVPCKDCGERYPTCVMDFHHRDPSEKEYDIASAVNHIRVGKGKLRAELAKCDVLCANCHRIRTWGNPVTEAEQTLWQCGII